jgi:hypothetical protein
MLLPWTNARFEEVLDFLRAEVPFGVTHVAA